VSQRYTTKDPSPRPSDQGEPNICLELSLRSEVSAISPFVDTLMCLIKKFRWIAEDEEDIEVALYEVLANAVIHGNHEDPGKQVRVSCRCGTDEVSTIAGTKDKDLTLARSQTLLPRNTLSPAMAVEYA